MGKKGKSKRKHQQLEKKEQKVLAAPDSFSKILVTGHPLSGYEEVMDLLYTQGVSRPLPAQDGKSITEITKILLSISKRNTGDKIEQFSVNPVWNNLALGIMLGNLDQKLWGWGESQSIRLLEYWHSVDPSMAFVLVYTSPEEFLRRLVESTQEEISEKKLKKHFLNWERYNEVLLKFYYSHPENTLLINSTELNNGNPTHVQPLAQFVGIDKVSILDKKITIEEGSPQSKLFVEYLGRKAIKKFSYLFDHYYELESVSNLPLKPTKKVVSPYRALNAAIRQEKLYQRKLSMLSEEARQLKKGLLDKDRHIITLQKELKHKEYNTADTERFQEELFVLQESIEQYHTELKQKDERLAEHKERFSTTEKKSDDLRKEVESIQRNLFDAQEKAEEFYLSYQRVERQLELVEARLRKAEEQKNGCKEHLRYKIGTLVRDKSKSPLGWLTLPFQIFFEVKKHNTQKKQG